MSKYFGTDGFRGEANIGLTVEHAYKIGRFIGWYYGREHRAKIVIGKDTRISGDMYEAALTAGLTASGADAFLLHIVPTPGVAFITRRGSYDCGIMISASHNPYGDNGIKLINGDGEKMQDEVIDEVEKYIDGLVPELPLASGDSIGRALDSSDEVRAYRDYVAYTSPIRFDGVRVGLDCSNGSASEISPEIFRNLGARVSVINNQPNGVNINKDCGSTHIDALRAFVKSQELDVGFAFDGDADRCLCVDENGELVDGDVVLYIYARYLKEKGEFGSSKVVATVASNTGLFKALADIGIECAKTDVGDKYVYECMKQNGYLIGGEQSGHTILSQFATTGDGTMTAVQILRVMAETGRKLSDLAAPVVLFPQVQKNVRVNDKNAVINDPDVVAAGKKVEKLLGDAGSVLLRKSGTEPLVRVTVEAMDVAVCEKYVEQIAAVIREKGYAEA